MATKADKTPGANGGPQASSGGSADALDATPNLPARIDSAPTPPAPAERLAAAPEDAIERFAFALWTSGRKDEAVEFLERQIARRREDAAAAPPPMQLDIVPAPAATIPAPPVPKRPFIVAGAAAALALVLWTGVDRIAALADWLPNQLGASRLDTPQTAARDPEPSAEPARRAENDVAPADSATTHMASAAAKREEQPSPAEASQQPEAPIVITSEERTRSELEVDAVEAKRVASQAADTPTIIGPAAETPPAPSFPPRFAQVGAQSVHAEPAARADAPSVVTASEEPRLETQAPVQTGSLATPAATGALPGTATPKAAKPEATTSVTLQELATTVTSAPRMPRPRPTPSPELVAALTAPAPEPQQATQRAAAQREPRRVAPAPRAAAPTVIPEPGGYSDRPRRFTIIGRVGAPPRVWRESDLQRMLAARRALAERRAAQRYRALRAEEPPGWYDDAPWDDPYADEWYYD